MIPLNSARRGASIGVVYYRVKKNDPFSTPPSMVSADSQYRQCCLQTAGEATPVLSSTAQGAYGAHLRELESGLVERGLGRKGAGLRALEAGTGLRAE